MSRHMSCRAVAMNGLQAALLGTLLGTLLAGCAQAPHTTLPSIPMAASFKETPATATATNTAPLTAQDWWQIYDDPELDRLQARLLANSPDLASALARYRQARAATDVARAGESPAINGSTGVMRNRQSALRPLRGANSPDEYNNGTLGLDFSYEVDLWGRIARQVDAGVAREQAARADLAWARLSLQAQLADTLFALRGLDDEALLVSQTEAAYRDALALITRRHAQGIASGLDLARARSQLESTRSQLRQTQAQRALLEHALAALVGANAAAFSLPPHVHAVAAAVPMVPTGVPSALLQRRPDIAAAQLRVVAAGATVGAAKTAFFPSLVLGAQAGWQSSDLARFAQMPNLYWAIGPSLAMNLFDGGRRRAQVAQAEAALDEAGQQYRTVVLGAFAQVEDQLALLHRYGEAAHDEQLAADAAGDALRHADSRYRQGAASYLEVVTAQTAHLQSQRSQLQLATRQLRASVQLVRALGGGWQADTRDSEDGGD